MKIWFSTDIEHFERSKRQFHRIQEFVWTVTVIEATGARRQIIGTSNRCGVMSFLNEVSGERKKTKMNRLQCIEKLNGNNFALNL